jgi:hypothetical protein
MAQADNYTFRRIVVDGQEEHGDVILLPSRNGVALAAPPRTRARSKHTAAAPCTRLAKGSDEPRF